MSALKHPTWQMGAKITIDSATLLNKGFEVIEARWLYDAPLEKIHAVVQPESIIHSMVEFDDGCVMAQMSYPTMELPIQLALTYPDRLDCGLKPLDFEKLGAIRFLPLDRKRFPCYDLALTALEMGDNYPCALNGAGEIAVRAFLDEKIPFLAYLASILKDDSYFPYEPPAGSKRFRNLIAGFLKTYHHIPLTASVRRNQYYIIYSHVTLCVYIILCIYGKMTCH
jgi:1-deoxy-D-xylulose-5-phosphate reductoisomerase